MAICAVIGVLIERFAYRPVRHHSRLTSLITAIGVSLLLGISAARSFSAPIRDFSADDSRRGLLSRRRADHQPEPADHRRRHRHDVRARIHRPSNADRQAMRATSFNLSVAKLMGINTDYVIAFTFALGSALAAVGGVMVALAIPRIDPLMGLMTGLKAFVAAVLGGIGNIPGAMIGGAHRSAGHGAQRHGLLHLPRRRGVRGAHSDPALPAGRHPGRRQRSRRSRRPSFACG